MGQIVRVQNIPTADQKAALNEAATPPTALNPFVTEADVPVDLDDLGDVDLTGAATDLVLKFNGTAWVPAAYSATFQFGISSFSDGESATQLCGALGEQWKAIGAISFSAAYSNGPADSAYVACSAWQANLTLSAPYTSGVNAEALNYPAAGGSHTFTLHATKGAATPTSQQTVTFHNYIFWGVLSKVSTYLESDVESLANNSLSGTKGRTISLTPGSGEYIIYALPTRLGTVTFWNNGIEGGFIAPETVSVTNANGLTENYYVYRSTHPNLGATTVTVV